MNPVRGRPGKINLEKMKEAIIKYKDILNNNNKIISKTHDVWKLIAQDLGNKVTTNNLYVFTMCNRHNIKNLILNKTLCNDKSANESALSDSLISNEKSICSSADDDTTEKVFVISLLREEYINLLTEKVYKRQTNKNGKTYYRLRKVLQPGKWQELITDKFWEATHMKCGFRFKNHYISADAMSGLINGKIIMNLTL